MTCHLVALALLFRQAGASQVEQFLTANGKTLAKVSLVPSRVRAHWWHYRLYEANAPALGDDFWAVLESSSFAALNQSLLRLRQQQTTWWSWLGKRGRPEPMSYTAFNTLGPIAVMDDEAWSNDWSGLGPGAAREIAARKRRLDAAQNLEDLLYGTFDDDRWRDTFERDLFRNNGVALYQAGWLGSAMARLRAIEVRLRSATPLSLNSVNRDMAELAAIAAHFQEAAGQLDKTKATTATLAPSMSTADALSLLNAKFTNYPVNAGEGGGSSAAGAMSWSFTESGFQLTQAPTGWYEATDVVPYSALDPATVRYDPLFGGGTRGGIVFLPNDAMRKSYRGPLGFLLPLGTTPRDAESLAQAFRRMVRIGNGIPVAEPPKDATQAQLDEPTRDLLTRLKSIADALAAFSSLQFRGAEIAAKSPPALAMIVDKRNGLWRDSEIYNSVAKYFSPAPTFTADDGKSLQPYPFMQRLGTPMRLDPIDPPTWTIVRVNRSGGDTNLTVREACEAIHKSTGQVYTVYRLVQERWSGTESSPKLLGMRLLAAKEVEAPSPASAQVLSNGFYDYAESLMTQGRIAEAERMYRRSVTMSPGWASAWNGLGVSVVRQGRIDEASQYCSQSVQLNPKFVLGLTNLADIRRAQGKLSESLDLAAKATELAPNDPWAHAVRGHALFANSDFAGAETEYRAAIKLEPTNGANYADLAGALLRQDKKTEATQMASEAIRLGWRTHWVYKELALPKDGGGE